MAFSALDYYLTKVSHGSAIFISTFLLIHLTAPTLATIGGSNLASRSLLLGREYYQTPLGEPYLVLAPLAAHALAGLAKRLFCPPRPLRTPLAATGYTVAVALLPIHLLVHRWYPADPASPILAVGPAELDFEFVKAALRVWPVRSWALYAGLVICIALHAADGARVIWSTYLRRLAGGYWSASRRRFVAVGAVALPVLAGLFVLSREPVLALSSTIRRFEAAFSRSFVYRM